MPTKFLVNPTQEAERQALQNGQWIVATVDPRMSWPMERQVVEYNGKDFLLFPQSTDSDHDAAIALQADRYGLDASSARREIMRFCSTLSWSENSGLDVIAWSGGNLPRPLGVRRGSVVTHFLETEHLPSPSTDEERAALAMYREGMSLDNPAYAVLSLYKVISVLIPDGRARGEWVAEALTRLDDHQAKERRDELDEVGVDVAVYLRNECRNAVAHAEVVPYVNPDEVDDHFRLSKDIPLFRNLAEMAIEEKTTLKRSHTLWREHLYELAGFKRYFPPGMLDRLVNSEQIAAGTSIELPGSYTVLARKGPEVISFRGLSPEIIRQVEGGVIFDFVDNNETLRLRTELSFAEERLKFDPVAGIWFSPDRKERSRVLAEINVLRFQRCILSNGHLEVWEEDEKTMLGRSETCIPVNCFVNDEFYKNELKALEEIIDGFNSAE